jgi:DNA-binding protein YbaB
VICLSGFEGCGKLGLVVTERGGVDTRIEELERLKQDVDAKLGEVRDLTAELRATRFEATDGAARAVVDGQGALVGLHIDDDAVGPRVAHPGRLGTQIVEAVKGARQAAAQENARRFHTILPEMYPAVQDQDDEWDPGRGLT